MTPSLLPILQSLFSMHLFSVVSFKCDMPHFFKSPRDLTQNGTLEKAQISGSFFLAITCDVVCLSIASKNYIRNGENSLAGNEKLFFAVFRF